MAGAVTCLVLNLGQFGVICLAPLSKFAPDPAPLCLSVCLSTVPSPFVTGMFPFPLRSGSLRHTL